MSKKQPQPEFSSSLSEFSVVAERLRKALRVAISHVIDDTPTTRVLAERLGVDKSLSWKCVRLATVADVASVLADLPGARGWPKVVAGFRAAGCPADAVAEVDGAMREIRERLKVRGMDRSLVQAMAGGLLDTSRQQTRMLRYRREHFRATAAIYGISARARLGAFLLAPARDDASASSADIVPMSMVDGLERSRPGMPHECFRPAYTTDRARYEAIDPASALPPLLERFSSPVSIGGEIRAGETGLSDAIEFLQQRPSRSEPMRLAFGEIGRAIAPRYADPSDDLIELSMPTGEAGEWQVMSVLLHRDLALVGEPTAALYGTLVQARFRQKWAERLRLPLESQVVETPGPTLPPALRRLAAPWRELIAFGVSALGRELSEFRAFQIAVPYPPAPSSLVMRWRRPDRPPIGRTSGEYA